MSKRERQREQGKCTFVRGHGDVVSLAHAAQLLQVSHELSRFRGADPPLADSGH